MTTHATADHDDAHAAHAHDFDGEPATELSPDEPRTPGWLPLVGAAVFTIVAVYFLARPSAPATDDGANAGEVGAVARPQAPTPAATQPQPRILQMPATAAPTASAGSSAKAPPRQLTPEQRQRVMDAIKKHGFGAQP